MSLTACRPRTIASLFLVVSCLAASTNAHALIRVPQDQPTVQAALLAASPGEVVLVSPGNYVGSLRFAGKDVRVRSTSGPTATRVEGNGDSAVDIGPGGELNGFTITGGHGTFGSGTQVHGDGTLIAHNIYDSNEPAGFSFATIWGNTASPVIDGNLFRNNGCDEQHLSAVVTFVNNSSPRIVNNVFVDNPCRGINMTLPQGTLPQVINNTLVGNRAAIHVDGRVPTGLQVFRNNLIVGNQIGLEVVFGSGYPTWQNNLVYENGANYVGIPDQTGPNGNRSADPLFANRLGRDLHLTLGSPAVDMGSATGAPATDFDGVLRPIGGGFDIGAFELDHTTGVLADLIEARVGGTGVALEWRIGDPGRREITLERREADLSWRTLVQLIADSYGRVRYLDSDVYAGTRYAYRLAFWDGANLTTAGEVEVLVPVPRIALAGAQPNPSDGRPLLVSFALASDAGASIELFDIGGRRLAFREVGELGAGAHTLALAKRLDPGIYLVRLRSGSALIQRKAIVIGG